MLKDELLDFINNTEENDHVDYKRDIYIKQKKIDFIVDVLAMANSEYIGDKFIVTGVNDIPGQPREIVGIDYIEDQERYQSIVDEYIEPRVNISYEIIDYNELKVGVFIISKENLDKPYMIKKQLQGNGNHLKEGDCFIRRNSRNCKAVRRDFDEMYHKKRSIRIQLNCGVIAIRPIHNANELGPQYHASVDVDIFNYGEASTVFKWGYVNIFNSNREYICSSRIVGADYKHMGADFMLKVSNNDQFNGGLWLNFESKDCVKLGLNEYGEPQDAFICKVILQDTEDNEYQSNEAEYCINAKGDILHKVWIKKGIKPRRNIFSIKNKI